MDVEDLIARLGFDPSWSEEEAWQRRSDVADKRCPFLRWRAWRDVEACSRKYGEGDHQQLLEAISICGYFGFPIPEWAAVGFNRCYTSWHRERVRTLDEAFQLERPKGKHINPRHNKRERHSLVLHTVRLLHREEKMPIGPALFEKAGKKLNLSAATVRDTYYDVIKLFGLDQDSTSKKS